MQKRSQSDALNKRFAI